MESIRMATQIPSYERIEQLTHINRVPIELIEKRARPMQWSGSGFIGATESFKEVLQRDWKTVEALGTTHIAIADRLREIWGQVKSKDSMLSFVPVDNVTPLKLREPKQPSTRITAFAVGIIMGIGSLIAAYFSPYALSGLLPAAGCLAYASRIKKVEPIKEETLSLEGHIAGYFGHQDDIFDQRKGWCLDLKLKDTKNNLSLKIGEGVIDYIEQYGFYEGGGEGNPYRVDPLKLVAILTGSTIPALQSRVNYSRLKAEACN